MHHNSEKELTQSKLETLTAIGVSCTFIHIHTNAYTNCFEATV